MTGQVILSAADAAVMIAGIDDVIAAKGQPKELEGPPRPGMGRSKPVAPWGGGMDRCRLGLDAGEALPSLASWPALPRGSFLPRMGKIEIRPA